MSDDPAVRAGIEEGARHHWAIASGGMTCVCGFVGDGENWISDHFTAVRVEAARPIIEAEIWAKAGEEFYGGDPPPSEIGGATDRSWMHAPITGVARGSGAADNGEDR